MRRLKGINPVEQHVEKIVVGVFALALLGVLAWQFLQPAPTVTVGKKTVPALDAYDEIGAVARTTDAAIKRAEPEGAPKDAGDALKQLASFEERYKGPVVPSRTLAAALDRPAPTPGGDHGGGKLNVPVAEAQLPAPARPMVASFMATVSPAEVQQHPEVAKVLPPKAPLDKAAVTVECTFDGTALRSALSVKPEPPAQPIPTNWWEGSTQILAAVLERQTMQPDGSWSKEERVAAMPGRVSFVDQLDKLNSAVELKDRAKWATDHAAEIRRPAYYAVALGDEWMAPSERESHEIAMAGNEQQIRLLNGQRDSLRRSIKSIEDQLARVGQGPAAPPPPPAGGGGGGGRAGGGGGGGVAPPVAPPGGDNRNNPEEARKRQLTKALDDNKAKLAKVEDQLRALGVNIPTDPNAQGAAGAGAAGAPGAKTAAEGPLLNDSNVRVWAHDVFVERGKTYRYRVRLALTNPYFGHGAAMVPEQAERLAKAGVTYTPASEWSDPVSVDPETYLFFTRANEDNAQTGSSASAQAELFKFVWGRWRKATAQVEPGDRVAAEIKAPDYTQFLAQAADPNNPGGQNPGGGGGAAPAGGGRPGGRGGGMSAPGGGGNAPVPPPAEGAGGTNVPAGAQVPVVTVPVVSDMVVLGVSSTTQLDGQGSKNVQQVFLRDPAGKVTTRVPDDERADATYGRVSRSAERGQKELTKAPERKAPPPDRPGDDRDRPPAGAGGRGG
jgi:hypothetical protein